MLDINKYKIDAGPGFDLVSSTEHFANLSPIEYNMTRDDIAKTIGCDSKALDKEVTMVTEKILNH